MHRPSSPPKPPLADSVIRLRPWAAADAEALVAVRADDPEMAYWLDRLPQPYTLEDARRYIAYGERGWAGQELETPFAVIDADDSALLGAIGVFWHDPEQGIAEVGYWTARPARGRGVATRAVRLVADWVLDELGYTRLELHVDARNAGSRRVAEKTGFIQEALIRTARLNARDGAPVDQVIYVRGGTPQ